MTMMVLIIMENFEGTRPLAILMRYTGKEKEEERQEAVKKIKDVWEKLRGSVRTERETDNKAE
jgi:ribosome recycling factor